MADLLKIIGLNVVNAIGFYLSFLYVTTWLRQTEHLAASTVFEINTVAIAILLLLIPAAGALSDRVGRKPVLLTATVGIFLFAWPLFWLMHHPVPALALLGQIGFAVLVAGVVGAGPATMVEALPRRVRCTSLSLLGIASLWQFSAEQRRWTPSIRSNTAMTTFLPPST
jgi:MHS family proline/betaine transporter-like MFS transporter